MTIVTPESPAAPVSTWSLRTRLLVSGLLLFHIVAVGLFPFTTPPGSRLAIAAFRFAPLRHYAEMAYMNHGFKFFAPNPGVQSRQIRYVVQTHDGKTVEGIFPDKNVNWPRLLYHRHFMLSEHLPVVPAEFVPSYARHLLHEYDGASVTLYERLHFVPIMEHAQAGLSLDDPRLFEQRMLGTFTPQDVGEIPVSPGDIKLPD